MTVEANIQMAPERINSMLEDLPPESVAFVEQFVQFLRQQAKKNRGVTATAVREERPPYLYPTVTLPASSLNKWLNLLPEGYEGDALADTEALFDETEHSTIAKPDDKLTKSPGCTD